MILNNKKRTHKNTLLNIKLYTLLTVFTFSLLFSNAQMPTMLKERFGNQIVKDDLTRYFITPKRIVWQSDTSTVKNAAALLKKGDSQTYFGIPKSKVCRMINTSGENPAFILDFGAELHGGIQITTATSNSKTPKVRICFGESVSEAMSNVHGDRESRGGATNHHAMRDFTVTLPGYGTLEIGNTGFRFVKIELVDTLIKDIKIKEIRAVALVRDIAYQGSFNSNDTLLNEIWNTGAYTVYLTMQNFLVDGIKRDRMVWMGDMHPEIMTINAVFGPQLIIPKSLDFCKNTTPLPKWINGISSYSLWWIIAHYDWYKYNGDLNYLKEQETYMSELLELLFTQVENNGEEKLGGKMRFLDWPSSENDKAVHAGLQALMVMTLERGAELCQEIGRDKVARKALSVAKKMRKHIPDMNNSKQAAALLALTNMVSADKADKDIISVDGVKNFSTFYGYYMLQARAMAGEYKSALNNIRQYWGSMLTMGATTFWEDFNIDWMENAARIDEIVPENKKDIHRDYGDYCYKNLRHSLCHGWASGPTAWLSEHVLGVKILEAGCKKVLIEPHLGDLEWVEGTYPTPMGLIKVRHKKQKDGTVKSTIDAPKGMKVIQGN